MKDLQNVTKIVVAFEQSPMLVVLGTPRAQQPMSDDAI
jgi:hypothetical protein